VWLALAAITGTARADLVDEVARQRQLPIKHPIAIEKLDADAFALRTHAAPAADPWGLGSAAPLDAVFDGSEVIARQDAPELAIAGAIDRALVEQSFGPPPLPPEAHRARELLETGDANALAIELALARAGKPPPWDDEELVAQLVADRPALAYIAAKRRRGWRAVDAMLRKPPATASEILHPGTHVAPVAVELTAPDGCTLDTTDVWGELGTRAFLTAHGLEPTAAAEAAEGWRGDRVIACTHGTRTLGLWRSEWATEADAERMQGAIALALGNAVLGVAIGEMRWLAIDGSLAWVERHGTTVDAAIGVPIYLAPELSANR
jgi:hypothetical protein